MNDSLRLSVRSRAASAAISQGQDVVIYTSRELVTGEDAEQSLAIGSVVSDGIVAIVQSIRRAAALSRRQGRGHLQRCGRTRVGRAPREVLGQILPGIPVWRLGKESRYPGMAYVVFPGNVGEDDALAQLVTQT